MEAEANALSPLLREVKACNPAHFVLVHGAGHGAWCWYKLRNLIELRGHRVTCVDLLACGIETTKSTAVQSFDDYNRPLDAVLIPPDSTEAPAKQHDSKVILVGHSAGCLSVTRAIHDPRSAATVAAAVYISGWMLPGGLIQHAKVNERLSEDILKLLYNKSPPEDVVLGSMLLRPTPPVSVFMEARWEGGGHWVDEVKRAFVKTSDEDRIFGSAKQEQTIKAWPPSMVFEVDSDHSPFFSTAQQLCDVLLQVAADCGYF